MHRKWVFNHLKGHANNFIRVDLKKILNRKVFQKTIEITLSQQKESYWLAPVH